MDYTAEAFDQMQLLWETRGFNDHQLRCVLRFEFGRDEETLRRAVRASMRAFPILATRYINDNKPRWTSLDPAECDRAFVVAHTEEEFEQFLVSKVDEGIGPQVRVCLLKARPFSVALKMNHMVCDATAFKAFLGFLSGAYTRLISNPSYGADAIVGDRNVLCVLNCFSLATRFRSLLLENKENNVTGEDRFPLSDSGQTRPFILTRKLGRERTEALKLCGQAKRATLNDVMLTAFYRSLFRRLALGNGAALRIPIMVDMRRFLEKRERISSLTNLTSTASTQLRCRPEECFEDTLDRVKAMMDQKKRADLGLNGFVKLDRAYRIMGNRIANRLLKSKMKHPLISMTNMGILDSAQMLFGDQCPSDAILCGSIKYRPYFQLAVSSYRGELTLSVNLLGSNQDRDHIQSFLDDMDTELSNWDCRKACESI